MLLFVPIPVYLYFQAQADWARLRSKPARRLVADRLSGATAALSWAGSKEFEGHDYIGYGWDQLSVAVSGLLFYYWGLRSGWSTPWVEAVLKAESR
jgi:hypothetical protein